MANQEVITIPLDLPRGEACAFAQLLKRTSYDDCLRVPTGTRDIPTAVKKWT